jgi:aspartate/methionine/tyrosine aminotransferase
MPTNLFSAAEEAFFMKAIAFCKAHDLLLIHDAPYVDLVGEQHLECVK